MSRPCQLGLTNDWPRLFNEYGNVQWPPGIRSSISARIVLLQNLRCSLRINVASVFLSVVRKSPHYGVQAVDMSTGNLLEKPHGKDPGVFALCRGGQRVGSYASRHIPARTPRQ